MAGTNTPHAAHEHSIAFFLKQSSAHNAKVGMIHHASRGLKLLFVAARRCMSQGLGELIYNRLAVTSHLKL